MAKKKSNAGRKPLGPGQGRTVNCGVPMTPAEAATIAAACAPRPRAEFIREAALAAAYVKFASTQPKPPSQ
jgi:hypothetical protein